MTDYDYAQVVMKAAGVEPLYRWVVGTHEASCFSASSQDACIRWKAQHSNYCVDNGYDVCRWESYPDPLTSGDAFLALWDALEAKGWRVEFRTLLDGTLAQVYKADEMGRPDLGSIFQGGHENRRAALVEAAGQALGVTQ